MGRRKQTNKETDNQQQSFRGGYGCKSGKGGSGNSRKRKAKKVEVSVDRDDINRADLPKAAPDNDFGWYNMFPELIDAVSNFAYGQPTGVKIPAYTFNSFKTPDGMEVISESGMDTVPGIMTLDYVPIIGNTADGPTSAINIAALDMFSYQRSRNSRSQSYDAPNLMMHVESCKSLIGAFWMGVRAYGALNLSSPFDRYTPRALVTAMNFDYDDLVRNKAQFRAALNQFAIDYNKLKVPVGMATFDRVQWLNSNVFIDSETVKAQMYMFNQVRVYRYTEAVTGPNYLQCKLISSYYGDNQDKFTVETFTQMLRDLMQPMIESEDIGTMTADIIKAYGLENCIVLPQISDEYVTVPGYSREVLMEIENTVICGNPVIINGFYSDPDMNGRTNMDICEVVPSDAYNGSPYLNQVIATDMNYSGVELPPVMAAGLNHAFANGKTIINMHHQDVKVEDTIVATRLAAVPYKHNGWIVNNALDAGYCLYDSLGSEIVINAQIFYNYVNNGTLTTGRRNIRALMGMNFVSATSSSKSANDIVNRLSKYVAFDWAPQFALYVQDYTQMTDDRYVAKVYPVKDFDNYITLSSYELAAMNEACMRSLYKVPLISVLGAKNR